MKTPLLKTHSPTQYPSLTVSTYSNQDLLALNINISDRQLVGERHGDYIAADKFAIGNTNI
jgi:hypothetical protein